MVSNQPSSKNHLPYYPPQKGDALFHLLRLARLGNWIEDPYPEQDQESVLNALESVAKNHNASLRPLLPLIYHNALKTALLHQLPSHIQEQLKQEALQLVAKDMANQHALKQILVQLNNKGIPVILLKGAAFAQNLYPKGAPRIGVDLDILVKEADFQGACEVLPELSMEPVVLDNGRLTTYDTLFERVFQPKNTATSTVEVHRGLTNPFIFHIEEQHLWSTSREHPAYGLDSVRILSPEDTLLHLAVHAFRDLDFCTHNVLDTHETYCQWRPDNEILLERASRWGAKHVLYYLLSNTKAIMDTPIPLSLLSTLKPDWFRDQLNKKILRTRLIQDNMSKSSGYRFIQLVSQISFPDKSSRGIHFQTHYIGTRVKDWLAS